jgi:serine/threonine-protein kinase
VNEIDPRPGDALGDYRVLETLGVGAFAKVFRVEVPGAEKPLALKLTREPVDSEEVARRALREIAVLQRLTNPHVVRIHDAGLWEDGRVFILTDCLDGAQLNAWHDFDTPLDLRKALDVILQACKGVAEAHSAGIVHRDLKPENLWVGPDDLVTVLDFGLARSWDSSSLVGQDATIGHVLVGTPHYTQPEQAVQGPLTPASDVYTLATVLYELLSGHTPFFADRPVSHVREELRDDPLAWLELHRKKPAIPITEHAGCENLPAALSDLLDRCLAKHPRRRPANATVLGQELREILDELGPPERRARTDAPTIRRPVDADASAATRSGGQLPPDEPSLDPPIDPRGPNAPCPGCGELHPDTHLRCPQTDVRLPLHGRVLDGRFRLVKVLGEGGMAVVWRARNVRVDRDVAIKLIRGSFSKDPEAVSRFLAEAKAAGRSRSPHICDVLDAGTSPIGPYIVMELLSGENLADRIRGGGALEPTLAVRILRQALVGLEAAHDAGIVHRDLKPENVFLHRTEESRELVAKLMDFGVSKFMAGGRLGPDTREGILLGTPRFMSPEQVRGATNADARADIWAMGAILYRALTAEYAFDARDPVDIMMKIRDEDPQPVTKLVSGIPEGLSDVIMRCLARKPEDRFQSAAELAEVLAPFENDPSTAAEPAAASKDEDKDGGGVRWLAAAAAVVVIGLGAAYALRGTSDPPEQANASATPPSTVPAAPSPETSDTGLATANAEESTEGTTQPPSIDKLVPPPPVHEEDEAKEPQASDTTEPTEMTIVVLKEVGPRGNLGEARRYCKGLAEKRHRGAGGWKLGNPTMVKKLKGDKTIKRGRYWTTAVHKGRAIVITLPAGKSSSYPISRKTPRPLCLATTTVPVEGE